jgi:hypothetical protein
LANILLPPEDLIGVVRSPNINYGGGVGYALAITTNRIVGARKSALIHAYEIYVGPSIKYPTSPPDRAKAQEVANEIIAGKEFELSKGSIAKIIYKKPGLYSRGHVIFDTSTQQIQLRIPMVQGAGAVSHTLGVLVASLNVFAPDRFVDEETGLLIRDELLRSVAEKQQKKHWW